MKNHLKQTPEKLTIPVLPHVRGLIFDCDGTLVDSMPIHHACWLETFIHFGEECPPDFLAPLNGMPSKQIIALFNERFSRSIDPDEFGAEKDRRAGKLLKTVGPILEVTEIVRRYHGRMPMAVASGGKRNSVMRSLRAIKMLDHFDAIVTADDPVPGKPAPDIFLEAARQLGIAPEFCQVFEDGDMGIQAAHAAGMEVLDVRDYLVVTAGG